MGVLDLLGENFGTQSTTTKKRGILSILKQEELTPTERIASDKSVFSSVNNVLKKVKNFVDPNDPYAHSSDEYAGMTRDERLAKYQEEGTQATTNAKRTNSAFGQYQQFKKAIPESARSVIKDIVQTSARGMATIGTEAGNLPARGANLLTGRSDALPFDSEIQTNDSAVTRAIFGGKPIKDFKTIGENAINTANSFSQKVNKTLGLSHKTTPIPKILAIPFGIAGSVLDASLFEGGDSTKQLFTGEIPEQVLKFFARTTDPVVIAESLKAIKVPEEIAVELGHSLSTAKTVDEVKDVLTGVIKYGPKTASIVEKQALPGSIENPEDAKTVVDNIVDNVRKNVPATSSFIKPKSSPKSSFKTLALRALTPQENSSLIRVNSVLNGESKTEIIAHTPGFVANDGKERPLVFSSDIANKIKNHGDVVPENLVLNANDWDYAIKNVDGNPDKINLIKKIPGGNDFLVIGANRDNGFFTVTHFEYTSKNGRELKNLLQNKGDALDKFGRTPESTTPDSKELVDSVGSSAEPITVFKPDNKSIQSTPEKSILSTSEDVLTTEARKYKSVEESKPQEMNITQYTESVGAGDSFGDLLAANDPNSMRYGEKNLRKTNERILSKQDKYYAAREDYRNLVKEGKIIDPSGEFTKEDLLKSDAKITDEKTKSEINRIERQIQTIENLGTMSHKKDGSLKPTYQRTVDIYKSQLTDIYNKAVGAPMKGEDTKIYYHGTTKENADKILSNGFNTESVALTPDIEEAKDYGDHIVQVRIKENARSIDTNGSREPLYHPDDIRVIRENKINTSMGKFNDAITPEEAEKRLRNLFDEHEVEFIYGEDIGTLIGKGSDKTLKGFHQPKRIIADLIALVERNGKVSNRTLYHEAFHAYLENFVSPGEKSKVINYVIENKKAELTKYSDKHYPSEEDKAEEWLADEAADYAATGKTDEKLKSFFQKIIDRIKRWIRGVKEFDDLFDRMLNKDRNTVNAKTGDKKPSLKVEDNRTPQEILADAEKKARESGGQQDRLNGLAELARNTETYDDFVYKIGNNPLLKQWRLDLQETGYGHFAPFYKQAHKTASGKVVEIPKPTIKQIAPEVKKAISGKIEPIMAATTNETMNTTEEDQDKLAGYGVYRDYLQERIQQHPGARMQRFMSKKDSNFNDFKNPDLAKTPSERAAIETRNTKIIEAAQSAFQDTAEHANFDNPDTIRTAIDEYKALQQELRDIKDEERAFRQKLNMKEKDIRMEKLRSNLEAKAKKYDFQIPQFDEKNAVDILDIISQKEVIKNHPARPFLKYANKRTGILPEIQTENPGEYGKAMQALLDKKGITFNQAQDAVTNFLQNQEVLDRMRDEHYNPIELIQSESVAKTPYSELLKELENAPVDSESIPFGDMLDDNRPGMNVKKKVGVHDYIRTPEKVLQKIGLEDEAILIKKQYAKYIKELPENIDKITAWAKRVPGEESARKIFDYLDGAADPDTGFKSPDVLTPEELKVGNEVKKWLEEWADRLNLKPHQRISNYITHIFDQDLIDKEFDVDLAKIIQDKVAGQVYDPFLEQRLGKLGYVRDAWRALDAYVKRATRKVNMDVALEQVKIAAEKLDIESYNYVKTYVDRINLRPTKTDNLIDNTIKQIAGYKFGVRPTANLSRKFRQLVFRGTLGLNIGSALRNLTQGANTYAMLGEKYTALGYMKLLSGLNQAELTREGILGMDVIQDRALSSTKKFWEKVDKGLFFLFETAEKINRGAAYFGAKAKYYAENSHMEPVKVDGKLQNTRVFKEGASEQDAIDYAKDMVEKTQFTFGSVDTPVALGSDIAKTLLQFQSYNVKQAEFLAEMAKNKNYAGLIRFVLASIGFLVTLGTLFGMKWQDLVPFSRYSLPPIISGPKKIIEGVVGKKDQFGNVPSGKRRLNTVVSGVVPFIPGGVQAKKTLDAITAIRQGESKNTSGNSQYKIKPGALNAARAALFGKSNLPEAKDYYGQKGDKVKEDIKLAYFSGDAAKTKQLIAQAVKDGYLSKDSLNAFKTNLRKEKKIHDIFTTVADKRYVEQFQKITSNDDKVDFLLNLRKKLGNEEFKKWWNKARTTVTSVSSGDDLPVLISDDLKDKFLKASKK